MPDYRKPGLEKSGRADNATLPAEGGFSIESTTMRLKSLKLRRAEAADKALEEHLRASSGGGRVEQVRQAPAAPSGPAGRVRHDERGMAVWDWAAASGEVAALSATNLMQKLDISALSIEQTQRSVKILEPGERDPGGGGDPYNQRTGKAGANTRPGALGGGDPYNQRALTRASDPIKRPPPAPGKPSGGSVLDQLTGKKK
jgi:hypothetical protein